MKVLITAGATREFFDPVRYISNPSTGKMGYALAQAAVEAGCEVTVIAANVALAAPAGATVVPVTTGDEMLAAALKAFPQCDLLFKTAAVCDFKPAVYNEHKLKKDGNGMTVDFVPTTDILKTLSRERRPEQILVGFAAETRDIETYAAKKLKEKNLDFVCANLVGRGNVGAFGSDDNTIVLLGRDGSRRIFGPADKVSVARALVATILKK
ncbi:MAG: hypothetical protein K6B46_04425 [Opitutales bacterium]|nr:hypothetical protein [Opitutales bacterium]